VSVLDVVLLSVLATALFLVAVFYIVRGINGVWRLVRDLVTVLIKTNTAIKEVTMRLYEARASLVAVHGELSFMRSITQAANPNFGQENPQPPLGRASTMPPSTGAPPFPTPVWDKFPTAEPAKPEDTDLRILEQDEQDIMDAQALEELRARGIEPDNEDEPRAAVGEEA